MTDLSYTWDVIPTGFNDYPFMGQVVSERVDGSGYVEWEALCTTKAEAERRAAQQYSFCRDAGQ